MITKDNKTRLFGSEVYKKNVDDIIEELDSSIEKGLPKFEVDQRQKTYGFNRIETEKPPSLAYFFLDHTLEFVSIILIGMSLIAFLNYIFFTPVVERFAEGIIIAVIVLINAISGAYQDYKSEKTAHKLKKIVTMIKATVIRDGRYKEIDSEELVPGDIVLLETGDRVPSDIRLIETEDLEILESNLTGESKPSLKNSNTINKDLSIAQRENMAYMNTYVTRGHGKGIVTSIGINTEIGLITKVSRAQIRHRSPFLDEVQKSARQISYIAIVLVFISTIVSLFYGKSNYQVFMLSAALIIGAVPAALPITVTYSLAHSMKVLANKNVLVRNLPFLESVGGVDVICTAKTGTITQNRMVVKKIFLPSENEPISPKDFDEKNNTELVRCALLANEAEFDSENKKYLGDPKDIGLLEFLKRKKINIEVRKKEYYILGFLPFLSKKNISQTLVKIGNKKVRYKKGEVNSILKSCNRILINGKTRALTKEHKEKINSVARNFSKNSLNNIALSYKYVSKEGLGEDSKEDIFLGIIGMIDPIREGVNEAITAFYDAGIEIKMITGDDLDIALSVAKDCGFKNIKAVTWNEIKDISDKKLEKIVEQSNVFADMDPVFKIKIVDILHKLGKKVAITGDGVNDTPAMYAAEVGIAMGSGSDIAKDAADIILVDDSFASIKEAIKYGRTSLSNIKKVANYLMTVNFFEVFLLFLASLAGFTPLRAIQILWVNFATDIFPAVGFSTDPPHPDIMKKKPTGKDEKILTKRIWYLLLGIGMKKIVIVFLIFFIVLYLSPGDTNILGIQGDLVFAQGAVFAWMGLFHIDRIIAIRWDEGWRGKNIFINKTVNYSFLWPILAKIIILYLPLGGFALSHFFYSKPLPLWIWGILLITLLFSIITALIIVKIITKILGKYGETEY